jgi:flagellar hook protein FlgE
MMRSLYSGVSGLENHQTRMDVLGSNISNVNTTGFKKNRVQFKDMLYQELSGAARPTETLGGVNPQQVGLGMSIASIDTIQTQGSMQSTGVQTDMAISGNGFFVLKNGDTTLYTRAGNFGLDGNGVLVNPGNGMRVQGWMARQLNGQTVLDTSRDTEQILIPVGGKDPAKATTEVDFLCNLDKRTPGIANPAAASPAETAAATWGTEIKTYDSFGQQHTLRINFTPAMGADGNKVPNTWNATVYVDPTNDPVTNAIVPNAARNAAVGVTGPAVPAAGAGAQFTLRFSNDGTLQSAVPGANAAAPAAAPAAGAQVLLNVAYDVPDTTPGAAGAAVRQNMSLNLGRVGSLQNTVTQYSEQSTTKAFFLDGRTMGYLENYKIDQSGTISGVYTNGTTRVLGQVALASFTNPGGLEKQGDTNFAATSNSGYANVGASGTAGKGKIISGTLEMSNVDLAEQFVDMIVTQRGFQANSRTIQTSDQMLQEILSLKR